MDENKKAEIKDLKELIEHGKELEVAQYIIDHLEEKLKALENEE